MKTHCITVVLIFSCAAASQQQNQQQSNTAHPTSIYLAPTDSQPKLTVNEVIKLVKARISDDVIIQELVREGRPFNLSASDMVRLKNVGVSDRVISVMIDPKAVPATQDSARTNSVQAPTSGAPQNTKPLTPLPSPRADLNGSTSGSVPSGASSGLPSEPGLYVLAGHEQTKILGQPVTFERTGSRLVSAVTLTIKATHDNIQLPGRHAQTLTGSKPTFAFLPSRNEIENGVTGGDLLLIKLETHGDRRQIEIAAGGSWRTSKGVSITHQLQALRSEPASGVYEITPANPLSTGEYAIYLQRGEGLPALLFDFSVQAVR